MSAMLPLQPLPSIMLEPIVRAALLEDLGRAGDITTDAVIPREVTMSGVIAARQPGVIAGADAAVMAFALMDVAVTATIGILLPLGFSSVRMEPVSS